MRMTLARPTSRRTILLATSVVVLIGLALGIGSLMDWSKQVVEAGYNAIKPGMSRAEVHRLVFGTGRIMLSEIGTSELIHIDGRYMIAVTYEPDPNLSPSPTNPAWDPKDGWVAREKMFLELGRGSRIENLLVHLRLKSPRSVDRVLMSK